MNPLPDIGRKGNGEKILRVTLLGRPCAEDGHGCGVPVPRKALILLAYLILDSRTGRLSRAEAAAILWEDLDEERQNGNLRQLLLRLRAVARDYRCADLFDVGNDDLWIGKGVVYTDIQVFRTVYANRAGSDILAICDAYGGELLEGVNAGGGQLSNWLRDRRAVLRREFTTVASNHLESSPGDRLPNHALLVAQKLLEAEPTHEAGHRTLMRLRAEAGDAEAVEAIYNRLKRLLRKEMQARPSQATQELFTVLLRGKDVGTAVSKGTNAPAALESPATVNRGIPRIALHAALTTVASVGQRESFLALLSELCVQLWHYRSFLILNPRIQNAAVPWQCPIATDSSSEYTIDITQHHSARKLTVSLRLVSNATKEVLWASSLNEESLLASDGFELSHSIAERIEANEIGLLSRGNATALRLSLYGQHLLQRMDLPAIRRARNNFRAALNIEPENIAAITGIARSFVREEIIAARSDDRLLEEGRNLAARAIALRPDDYRGYQTLGIVNLYSHRFDSCLDYLYHAQRLSPSIPYLSYDLSDALVYDGQHAEAIRETEKAKSTLKFHTDAGRWLVAGAKYLQGDYRAAANELAEMQDPTAASRFRAGVHAMLGENDAAAAYVNDAMEFNPDFNARRWVSVSPYRRREDREHSSTGLLSAGFK